MASLAAFSTYAGSTSNVTMGHMSKEVPGICDASAAIGHVHGFTCNLFRPICRALFSRPGTIFNQ
ncbi:hypothetical protein [Methanocella arvoryzae]|uniref:hypothetical protein n=1 Tax=Methanocella arvoryzae TaxID=1175445 RepID=UPI00130526C6|nr:hypothetical protein [Methanocella arvoryzae]